MANKRMDTDSSTPKFKNVAKKKKKKKILSVIINCDLYFSPTGIKNVLISSKIKKKKNIEFRAFP